MNAVVGLSVVVPYCQQQRQLDLVLAALELQTLPWTDFEVIVVDDGSTQPPQLAQHPYPLRLLRQPDLGFRASAARALGADNAHGRLLAFLDADTVPEPDYLRQLVEAVVRPGHPVLAVGRRRHASLGAWSDPDLVGWFGGTNPGPEVLPEPEWLRRAYTESDNLRLADDRSYRFVISAVMALPTSLYRRAGGFDPGFVGYGGEDWDLANRCWLAGADFAHVPAAIAWHDGPDFADRGTDPIGRVQLKNQETLRLAQVLTDPQARDPRLIWAYPRTVIRLHGIHHGAELAAMLGSLLDRTDAAVWLVDEPQVPEWAAHDPRIRVGRPTIDVIRRCVLQLDAATALALGSGSVVQSDGDFESDDDFEVRETSSGEVLLRLRRTRSIARGEERVRVVDPAELGISRFDNGFSLESCWSR